MARKRGAPGTTANAAGILKDLVNQFSDPLNFYRELIQNAIDAGANRITVSVDWKDGEAVLAVEDDGDGMDESIIDGYLLVLFKSSKEDDFTKIGKFGIGFVSVFAMQPELVRVVTGRDGQSWRLDFPSPNHWKKYKLRDPVEGTRVEVRKRVSEKEFSKLAEASRRTIVYWCKHSETRIYFHDRTRPGRPEQLTSPFGLGAVEAHRYTEEGTEIALAFRPAGAKPFLGFYNRGLTLHESETALFHGVDVKIKSRYLEHTLTRDNVMRDANYEKVMALTRRLVENDLPEVLRARLRETATRIGALAKEGGPVPAALQSEWMRGFPYLEWLYSGFVSRWRRGDWRIFPTVHGAPVSLEQARAAWKRHGALFMDDSAGRVSRALPAADYPALVHGPWIDPLVKQWGAPAPALLSRAFLFPARLAEAALEPGLRALLKTARALDGRTGSTFLSIEAGDFAYAGSAIERRRFILQKKPFALERDDGGADRGLWSVFGAKRHAVVNAAHEDVARLAALHAARPGFAAFLLLKIMHLHAGHAPDTSNARHSRLAEALEGRLLAAALERDAAAAKEAAR